ARLDPTPLLRGGCRVRLVAFHCTGVRRWVRGARRRIPPQGGRGASRQRFDREGPQRQTSRHRRAHPHCAHGIGTYGDDMTLDLSHRKIAVVGGDAREQEIARLAASTGATVTAYGFPWPAEGIPGVELATSPEEAMRGADYALFPIPGQADNGDLFAPHAPAPIRPNRELLSVMARPAAIILGWANDELKATAE